MGPAEYWLTVGQSDQLQELQIPTWKVTPGSKKSMIWKGQIPDPAEEFLQNICS